MLEINKIYNMDCVQGLNLIEDNSVDLIIIDPPYIVTKEQWDKKDVVSPQLSKELFRVLKSTGNFYCWGGIGEKSQTIINWFLIFKNTGWYFKDWITWKKQRGMGMRKGWLYTREEVLWFVKDNKKFIWNTECQYSTEKYDDAWIKRLKKEYKRLTNVWTDIKEETLSGLTGIKDIIKKDKNHFTPKPEKAIERIILAHTTKNDIVLDCFLGSGTTAYCAKKLNRNYIGIDNNKYYCEIAEERLEKI